MADNNILANTVGGGITGVVGMGLDMLTDGWRKDRQLEQQRKLQELQIKGNKEMTEFVADLQAKKQLELWEKTNLSAQRKEAEKAGLGIGLLYKGTGSGVTGGGVSGANVSSTTAGEGSNGMGLMAGLQAAALGAQTEVAKSQARVNNAKADNIEGVEKDNAKLEGIIKEYTGKEMKSYFENVREPNRGVEQQTHQYELEARQGVANTIYEMWVEGKLKQKSNAELESILVNNAKSRAERKNIEKTLDLITAEIEGKNIANMIDEITAEWVTGTGLKGSDAKDIVMKLLGGMISMGMKGGKK